MSLSDFIYHLLILIAIIQSFVAVKNGHKRFVYIFYLLILTEGIELLVFLLLKLKLRFAYIYHIYTIVEFSLIALYFRSLFTSKVFKLLVGYSIPIYCIYSLAMSAFYYQFRALPGLNLAFEGLLLFMFCIYTLFKHDPGTNGSFFSDPDILLTLGIFIFFGATFFYNGVYTTLLRYNESRALELFMFINKPLNLVMYSLINISFICLRMKKKYTTQ